MTKVTIEVVLMIVTSSTNTCCNGTIPMIQVTMDHHQQCKNFTSDKEPSENDSSDIKPVMFHNMNAPNVNVLLNSLVDNGYLYVKL